MSRNSRQAQIITQSARIVGLQREIQMLKNGNVPRSDFATAINDGNRLSTLLTNLLELDPSLNRFRIDNAGFAFGNIRDWDHEGIATAVEHRRAEKLADKYAPKTKPEQRETRDFSKFNGSVEVKLPPEGVGFARGGYVSGGLGLSKYDHDLLSDINTKHVADRGSYLSDIRAEGYLGATKSETAKAAE